MLSKPVIISASRRTDIPSFYAKWFINRIRAGYCVVPNPQFPQRVSYVSLKPEDVAVIVFWTRHPRPLMPYLSELDERGYKYYFQYTLMNNPVELDPGMPELEKRIETFQELSTAIGAERVIWRYDPIVISPKTPPEFHTETHQLIAERLSGYTTRNVISIVDTHYRKIQPRLGIAKRNGAPFQPWQDNFGEFVRKLADTAKNYNMEIQSCAEDIDLGKYGVKPGKCIDDDLIEKVFKLEVSKKKDKGQREACGCVQSRDIGMYDTCLFGCVYCYATSSFEKARENHKQHYPDSPSLIGWFDVPEDKTTVTVEKSSEAQLSLDLNGR